MNSLKQNHTDEYDVREDEDQGFKLQEILDLLVAAGYFRARIKGLSAFDKVVGGMVWSMDGCNFDLNVDLLFQENSTIGQKIALTEKIVMVLPRMECPHRIEPHQIQGLDFIHIYPVIQWLVKRSVKVREERREFIRNHAILKFNNEFGSKNKNIKSTADQIKRVEDVFRRKRLFKRKNNLASNEELQVESTLLEYGFPYVPLKGEVHLSEQHFAETQEFTDVLPLKTMGNIVNSQAEKIAQASQQFAKLKMDIENSGSSLQKKQKDMILEKKESLLQEKKQLQEEIEQLMSKGLKVKQNLEAFDCDPEGKSEQSGVYQLLRNLILQEENLKKQERLFREHCRMKLETFQNLSKEALERNQSRENNVTDNQCDEEREKVQSLRLQIAKKNRAIAFLQRQSDEIPGRGELAQYQRRFLELYNEVAQKHEETKQFYTMYNTLDDTKLYLTKELSLLNSVLDNYSEAMSNSIDKEEFMTQFESIVSAIKQNKQKVEKRKIEERNRRDKLSKQLLDLVEQQRNYVNIVKQLKLECKKNEELLALFRKRS